MKLNISNPAGGPGRTSKRSAAGIGSGRNGRALGLWPVAGGCRAVWGMTLPEMMVAVGVGSLILMVLAQVFTTSAFSFAAMTNYVSLGSRSRLALDQMTREIRGAGDLVEFSASRLKFALLGQANAFLVYEWDAQSRQLTESKTGNPQAKVLLTECDQLAFSMRDSVFAPTTAVSEGKGISVAWRCSRTILGKKTTTEDMEQALIIMRNKPL